MSDDNNRAVKKPKLRKVKKYTFTSLLGRALPMFFECDCGKVYKIEFAEIKILDTGIKKGGSYKI